MRRTHIKTRKEFGNAFNRLYINLKPHVVLEVNFDRGFGSFNIFLSIGDAVIHEIVGLENEWAVQKIVNALVLEFTGTERRIVLVGLLKV